jgi:hypothetical protein
MRSVLRSKKRSDSTREPAERSAQERGRAAESATRDDDQEAKVMVVGPPGCCGFVDESVALSSGRKR